MCVCCRDPRDKVVLKGCVASGWIYLSALWLSSARGRGRATRKEGVGIALDEKATVAWKDAGEVLEVVSSRIISARLKWVDTGKEKKGWSRRASGT